MGGGSSKPSDNNNMDNLESVNCGIDENKCQVSFDRTASELRHLPKNAFVFDIVDVGGGYQVGVFRANGTNRGNKSKRFQTGELKKRGIDVNQQSCVVKLTKTGNFELNDIF